MAEGPNSALASSGRLRKPNRRVGLAGKLQSDFGTSVVSPNMGTPASLTATLKYDKEVEIAKEVSEDEEDVDDRLETIPELPQGARVRRKPQLPVQVGGGGRGGDEDEEEEEEKAPSTIEHLLSAGRG